MTELNNNANANDRLAELKKRKHKHDVYIKTRHGKKTISSKEWYNILTSEEAQYKPEFNLRMAEVISSNAAATEGQKLTRQYWSESESSHFGFTYRKVDDISRIKEMFETIDKVLFAAATYCECDTINLSKLEKALVGDDEFIVETESMEHLNWMFKCVQFLCNDALRDNSMSMPKFYAVSAENGMEFNWRSWIVTADYVSKIFDVGDGGGDITITDDGMTIRFTPTVPTVGEIYVEDDDYCLVSFYDAIKNLVAEYYENF